MSGILGPLGAAAAMSLSSLVVTGNSVRLLRWRPSE
jgi:cation transport ATPase